MPRYLVPALVLGLVLPAFPVRAEDAFAAFGVTSLAPPLPAAELRLPTLDGTQVNLADLKGRVVLVNFWATWCAPCREEMPGLEQLARRYRERGLVVLAVNEDDDDGVRARRFAARHQLSMPILVDGAGAVAKRYRASGLPTTLLIAADGRVIVRVAGAKDWDGPAAAALIESLLGPPR